MRKVLSDTGIPNLEGQVLVDLSDRRGRGSFGDVYMGQETGIVRNSTCLSGS